MTGMIKDPKHQIVYDAMLIGREMTASEIADKIKRERGIGLSTKSVTLSLRSLSALGVISSDDIKGADISVWMRQPEIKEAQKVRWPRVIKKNAEKPVQCIVDYFGRRDEAGLSRAWGKLAKREGHAKKLPPSIEMRQNNTPADGDKSSNRILEHLEKYGPSTVSEIAKAIGVTTNSIGGRLRDMRKYDLVTPNVAVKPTRWKVRKTGGRKRSSLPQEVINLLSDGRSMTSREIAAVTKWHHNTIGHALRGMVREGVLASSDVKHMVGNTKTTSKSYRLAEGIEE